MNAKSATIRKIIIETLHATGGGHYGGALSVVDILMVLCTKIFNMDDSFFGDPWRDRLILSKGHSAITLYAILAKLNILNESELKNYSVFMGGLDAHPDMLTTRGIEFSTGSLGQGLSVGLGMAFGLRRKSDAHVWVVLGDGECQEGQIWEAALLASRYNINNLHVIVDANGAQEFGYRHDKTLQSNPLPKLCEKWQSFGWEAILVDGHNHTQLEKACKSIRSVRNSPSIIIAQTKKGRGVRQFENIPEDSHWASLSTEEFCLALTEVENHG